MAKTAKKTKSVVKKLLKPVAKFLKKQGKDETPKKAPAKAVAKPVAKPLPKTPAKKTEVTKAAPEKEAAQKKLERPVASVKAKSTKPDAKNKKSKPAPADLDDDLMVSDDEEIGGEEIPDLSDFVEDEEPEVEESLEIEIEETLSVVAGASSDEDAILTDAEGRPYCKVKDCDQIAAVDGYCRYHYLLLWKRIQVRRKILADGKLERYVEELTARYPDKFLEMIKRDLRSEKDFQAAIAELEIDESGLDNDFEDESAQVLDEVRGFGAESSMSDDDDF